MIVDNKDLMQTLSSFNVAVLPTSHFTKALEKRMFPLNIVALATIKAQSLPIGETLEIYSCDKFKATVELKKVSAKVALLITGWKGVRNNNENKTGHNNENNENNHNNKNIKNYLSSSISSNSNFRMCS